jgi:hypothetical protein
MNLAAGLTWSQTTFAFGVDVASKATAILMIVLLIQNLLGRRRASLGSAVGNAGLIGLLLLPVSALAFPSVPIACLPVWVKVPRADAAAVSNPPSTSDWLRTRSEDAVPNGPEPDNVSAASQPVGKFTRAADDTPRVPPAAEILAEGLPVGSTLPRKIDWAALAIMGYMLGALVLMARLGTSMLAVARLRHSCVKVVSRSFFHGQPTSDLNRHRKVCRLDGRRRPVPHRAGQAGGMVPCGNRQGTRPRRSSREDRLGGPASRDHPGSASPVPGPGGRSRGQANRRGVRRSCRLARLPVPGSLPVDRRQWPVPLG